MKNSGIFKAPMLGKWLYPLLCVAVVAVSVGSVAVYRKTTNDLANDLVNDTVDTPNDIDYSEVDKLIGGLQQGTPVIGNDPVNDQSNVEEVVEDIETQLQEIFSQKAVYMPIKNPRIIGEFSFGELVKSSSGVWKTHDGVDLAAELGDPVKSMTSGTVEKVYRDPLWGNCVEIDHGDAITAHYYGLSDDIKFGEGDSVKAGEIIGYVGETEIESDMEPHLHFALKQADKWIDPVGYVEPYK